jgi:hypothetical protein
LKGKKRRGKKDRGSELYYFIKEQNMWQKNGDEKMKLKFGGEIMG